MQRHRQRLSLYPDHVSGGLDTYYFGAELLAHILPRNDSQPVVRVNVMPPDDKEKQVLTLITQNADVMGFTIAEYLPFDEHELHKMLSGIRIFIE